MVSKKSNKHLFVQVEDRNFDKNKKEKKNQNDMGHFYYLIATNTQERERE